MRVPVSDLVGHPGHTRALVRAVEVTELGADEDLGPADGTLVAPLQLDVQLEAVVEGILVRGTVEVDLEVPCARCLEPQRLEQTVAVAELFADPRREDEDGGDEDAYAITEDLSEIDLGPLLRDTVVMEVPVRVLCRDDCAGLCPTCGENLNERDCGHTGQQDADPRWSKLAELDLRNDA